MDLNKAKIVVKNLSKEDMFTTTKKFTSLKG